MPRALSYFSGFQPTEFSCWLGLKPGQSGQLLVAEFSVEDER